jgi:hypothetical protein
MLPDFLQRFKIMIAKLVRSADQVSEGNDMTRLLISTFLMTTLIVMASKNICVAGQTIRGAVPSATSKSATLELSIALPIEHIPLGQKPWVHLTVKNLGREEIAYPRDRVYVEGPKGEPPTTLVQRSITGRFNPGDKPIPPTGFRPPIAPAGLPGDTFTIKYDLSYLYELKEPGKYTVYIEVFDSLSEKPNAKTATDNWLRSPTATFEMQAPTR